MAVPRQYSRIEHSDCSPTMASVWAYWATPGSSITYAVWIGRSTFTFGGTWMNAPPVQKAAAAAANLPSSWDRRCMYHSRTSSGCSRKASSSELTITPCSVSSGATSTWIVVAPRWTTIAPTSSSPSASARAAGGTSVRS